MNAFILREISTEHLPVLDRMLQLYVHEMNKYFEYTIVLDDDGRYRIKSAAEYLAGGWGYFIIVSCEYAGFILLNRQTKAREGFFIAEFFILPRYRKGLFYRDVIFSLFASLEGMVEYRVLKNNRRALSLFEDLTKKYLLVIHKTDEFENGIEYFRFTLNTANLTYDTDKYKNHFRPVLKPRSDS